jgi:hypothetical protein
MKNNNIQFWVIVIIIALIAGVIGSVVGAKISGNAIWAYGSKVPYSSNYKQVYTAQEVYNKIEIDEKISRLALNLNSWVVDNETAPVYPRTGSSVSAKCPPGKFVINGGCFISGVSSFISGVSLVYTGPIYNGGDPNLDWACSAYNAGDSMANLTAYAICINTS